MRKTIVCKSLWYRVRVIAKCKKLGYMWASEYDPKLSIEEFPYINIYSDNTFQVAVIPATSDFIKASQWLRENK